MEKNGVVYLPFQFDERRRKENLFFMKIYKNNRERSRVIYIYTRVACVASADSPISAASTLLLLGAGEKFSLLWFSDILKLMMLNSYKHGSCTFFS